MRPHFNRCQLEILFSTLVLAVLQRAQQTTMVNYSYLRMVNYSYLRNSLLDGSISMDSDSTPPLGSHVSGYVFREGKKVYSVLVSCAYVTMHRLINALNCTLNKDRERLQFVLVVLSLEVSYGFVLSFDNM
jgi:hypothetical protein